MNIELKVIGPNQTEVRLGEKVLFFSYDTLVAVVTKYECYRAVSSTAPKWSKTTTKHVNDWCTNNAIEVTHEQLKELANGDH